MSFTLLLWGFMLLIYFSARNNRTNQWAAITIFIFSFGTFKEYLYFEFFPLLLKDFGLVIRMSYIESLYSIMTALLYYLVMPCCVIFASYFSSYPNKNPKLFYILGYCSFIPAIIMSFFFNPIKTSLYQHNSRIFWYVLAIYNLLFGIIMTVLMIQTIHNAKSLFR